MFRSATINEFDNTFNDKSRKKRNSLPLVPILKQVARNPKKINFRKLIDCDWIKRIFSKIISSIENSFVDVLATDES